MKIINKQSGYYNYRLIFEARKSARVRGLSFECACIGAAVDLFPRESFKMKRGHQTMLSFLSTAEKSPRQTGNNNFRIKSYKYSMLFQFWK